MSESEILCQISTFMAAGHETTASALVWILYALSLYPQIQSTLRQQIVNISPSSPSLDDDIARLTYLDHVVREALRLYSPVSTTMRVCAVGDGWDEIPLSKPIVDRNGRERQSVSIRKGDIVSVPLAAVNRGKQLWGEDAMDFK